MSSRRRSGVTIQGSEIDYTFFALTTLLLAFFIFFDSRVTPNAIRQAGVIGSVNREFHNPVRLKSSTDQISEIAHGAGFSFQERGGTFVLTLPGARAFESGSDVIRPEVYIVLSRLVPIIRESDLRLDIEGHTDDQPISGGRFRSNWELSSARAVSVLRLFLSSGIPATRLSASGRGEFVPIASNKTEEGRALNRRVVLTLSGGKGRV